MREIKLKNDKLYQLLEKKDVLIKEGREISKRIEKDDQERHKIGLKVQKLKDKTAQLLEKEDIETGEFEYIQQLDVKDGEVVVTVQDSVEEFKKAYLERIKEESSEK